MQEGPAFQCVTRIGFEPMTYCLEGSCSIQLSYRAFIRDAKVIKNSSYICGQMRKYEDTYRHKGMRKQLVETLRQKGITDEKVLSVINEIPRHYFMDSAFEKSAYDDRALPIAESQTISQPYTVAYQTQLLDVKPHEKVLEIGTGSGYQSIVLAKMGAQVFTVERQKKLFDAHRSFVLRKQLSQHKIFLWRWLRGPPHICSVR